MKAIATDRAPDAVGPYSQGIDTGNLVFTSGQIPVDPKTGELKTDIKEATAQCLENVKAVLEAAGSSLNKTVKVTIFIKDMDLFDNVNEVYGKYFTDHKPARSCIAIVDMPAESIVEIEAIAIK